MIVITVRVTRHALRPPRMVADSDPVSGSLIGSVRAPATAMQKLKLITGLTVYKGALLKNLGPVSLTRQAVEIAIRDPYVHPHNTRCCFQSRTTL
jgi:hypothetical protein